MRLRVAIAVVMALVFAGAASADEQQDQLIAQLRTLGKAVDDMSMNISKATTDTDAQVLATATREALDKGLAQDQPKVDVKASAGFCRVSIVAPNWKLWSESHKGKIADHGATVH